MRVAAHLFLCLLFFAVRSEGFLPGRPLDEGAYFGFGVQGRF